jgi:ubiquinone/menaquinone biosynthesis C-methylase UbiE
MKFSKIFDRWAWIYDLPMRLFRNTNKTTNAIKNLAQVKSSDIALEVGGGTGLMSKALINDVKEITILDPSEMMLSKINNKQIKKVVGVAQNMPFKDKTFDLIYITDAFHHFTNGYDREDWRETTAKCVDELLRVLKKDGHLMIAEIDPEIFFGKLVTLFENNIMRWGSCFYTRSELLKLFAKHDVDTKIFDLDYMTYLAKISK